jgi:hypothetical protein
LVPEVGIGHWVVVTGMSNSCHWDDDESPLNWVRVNNPYNNRVEYYPWKDFKISMKKGEAAYQLVELWQ